MGKYFLGIDVGSSSVKTMIFDAESGTAVGHATYPQSELSIDSLQTGWAEQDPEIWWDCFKVGLADLQSRTDVDTRLIAGIGISYQMHGLVLVDENRQLLRDSIIWCDSRAVEMGEQAFEAIGRGKCLDTLLNSPGNFTASKLGWVKAHEPDIYDRIRKFMLPGDYIAMKLSGEITTTVGGLSEGMFWDFQGKQVSKEVMDHFGFDTSIIPEVVPSIGEQVSVTSSVADELGLSPGVKITYRAGDQPSNAFSLGVLDPGQVAATAGTSGVIYAVTDEQIRDERSRINTFLHVNNSQDHDRNGVLICVNGAGSMYSWLRRLLSISATNLSFEDMNILAQQACVGSEGLLFYPFGNGAERILDGRLAGADLRNLDFNIHGPSHLIRAGKEGIVFALNLGFDILTEMGVPCDTIKAGKANLFLSDSFREIFANVTRTVLQIYDTDGAEGAARGAALGAGYYTDTDQAFDSLELIEEIEPTPDLVDRYGEIYESWKQNL